LSGSKSKVLRTLPASISSPLRRLPPRFLNTPSTSLVGTRTWRRARGSRHAWRTRGGGPHKPRTAASCRADAGQRAGAVARPAKTWRASPCRRGDRSVPRSREPTPGASGQRRQGRSCGRSVGVIACARPCGPESRARAVRRHDGTVGRKFRAARQVGGVLCRGSGRRGEYRPQRFSRHRARPDGRVGLRAGARGSVTQHQGLSHRGWIAAARHGAPVQVWTRGRPLPGSCFPIAALPHDPSP
jgi:hypothetical protein